MSYYFKKFERNDLKFCTSYKNKRIAWVKTLNASLFRSNLQKKEKIHNNYPQKLYQNVLCLFTEFFNFKNLNIFQSIAFNIQSNNFTLAAALHRFAANLPPTFVS